MFFFFYNTRCYVMFVTAVCGFLFLLKLSRRIRVSKQVQVQFCYDLRGIWLRATSLTRNQNSYILRLEWASRLIKNAGDVIQSCRNACCGWAKHMRSEYKQFFRIHHKKGVKLPSKDKDSCTKRLSDKTLGVGRFLQTRMLKNIADCEHYADSRPCL